MPSFASLLAATGVVPSTQLPTRRTEPDSIWLILATPEDRAAALTALYGQWVTLADRSVQLNYQMTYRDANGFGLHVANTPAWARIENPAAAARYAVSVA